MAETKTLSFAGAVFEPPCLAPGLQGALRAQQHWHTNSFLSFLAKARDLPRFLHACDQAQTHARLVSHFDFQ